MPKFKNMFGFGKDAYRAPQIAPIPPRREGAETGVYINESERAIVIKLLDTGKNECLPELLGHIEMAKDIVKQTISVWHQKEKMRSAILVPKGNGHA